MELKKKKQFPSAPKKEATNLCVDKGFLLPSGMAVRCLLFLLALQTIPPECWALVPEIALVKSPAPSKSSNDVIAAWRPNNPPVTSNSIHVAGKKKKTKKKKTRHRDKWPPVWPNEPSADEYIQKKI